MRAVIDEKKVPVPPPADDDVVRAEPRDRSSWPSTYRVNEVLSTGDLNKHGLSIRRNEAVAGAFWGHRLRGATGYTLRVAPCRALRLVSAEKNTRTAGKKLCGFVALDVAALEKRKSLT